MSQLADLLERRAARLITRWLHRLRETIALEDGCEVQLVDHIPDLLQDLRAALRQGRTPAVISTAKAHGRQRYQIGFSLNALVREYALLSECIWETVTETSAVVTLPELRILNDFILNAITDGVTEHGQCAIETRQRQSEREQHILGIVSHDLRGPLNVIQMGAALLSEREDLDERALRTVVRIQSSATRAARLVSGLLDFTQARLGGGIRIHAVPTELHSLTQGMVDEAAAAYPTRTVEVMSSGDGRGHWDADRISQVVQNLVINALTYSPEGTPVQVVTSGEVDGVTLSVHNLGRPIPPQLMTSIFRPMQRASDDVAKMGGSVGLGLYIVQSIVAAHRGRIDVLSTANAGTTFTVWLPRTTSA